nr:extracellular ribonuclease LE-like [Ipomoea batatas]
MGTYPSTVIPAKPHDEYQISDLVSRMQQEWPDLACPSGNARSSGRMNGINMAQCSESVLDQHSYFGDHFKPQIKLDLAPILETAGGMDSYNLRQHTNKQSKTQWDMLLDRMQQRCQWQHPAYQVSSVVDASGTNSNQMPCFPTGTCASSIKSIFRVFWELFSFDE